MVTGTGLQAGVLIVRVVDLLGTQGAGWIGGIDLPSTALGLVQQLLDQPERGVFADLIVHILDHGQRVPGRLARNYERKRFGKRYSFYGGSPVASRCFPWSLSGTGGSRGDLAEVPGNVTDVRCGFEFWFFGLPCDDECFKAHAAQTTGAFRKEEGSFVAIREGTLLGFRFRSLSGSPQG